MSRSDCPICDGTGYRDVKSPDDSPGYAPCACNPREQTVTNHPCGCSEYHETDIHGRTIATGTNFCADHWTKIWESYTP